jgi:hypothetical protein
MELQPWAEVVTRTVRKYLPDVRAFRKGKNIVWKLQGHRAILEPDGNTWWMRITDKTGAVGPRSFDERHDAASAGIAANNIVVHFDPRWCRGIDVAPFDSAQV